MGEVNREAARQSCNGSAIESIWRVTIRFLLLTLFIFLLLPKHSIASGNSVILLPPVVERLDEAGLLLVESALVEGFSANVIVYSGQEVKETIQESISETECSAEKCVNNLAVKYNSEFFADFSAVRDDDVYLISLKLDNVITSGNILTRVVTCEECSILELVKKAKSLAFHAGKKLKFGSKPAGNRSQNEPSGNIDTHIQSLNNLMRSY